jgi:anti-sigma regulatory factor (Ser/Thr protein kinase)
MKAHLVRRAEARVEQLTGMVLCQDVRGERGENAFPKGRVVQERDVSALMAVPWDELHVIEPEPGELHEDEAGRRIATAATGEGITVGTLAGGHWPLSATRRGILHVEVEQLRRANSVEGACIYTLYDGQIVEPGEIVARAKITPFVLEAARVEAVERLARETNGLVRVRPFQAMTVAAVVQETLGEKAMTRFKEALGTKVAWFGSRLLEPAFVRPSDVDIAAAIERAASGIRPAADAKQVTLEVRRSGFVGELRTDPVRLEQILVNLLSNAVRHGPEKGSVVVEVAAADSEVRFAVVDHGPGIPPELQTRIFEPFERFDPHSGVGTGLGLPVSRRLAEVLGGRLTVESRPGQGATFTLALPMAPPSV